MGVGKNRIRSAEVGKIVIINKRGDVYLARESNKKNIANVTYMFKNLFNCI